MSLRRTQVGGGGKEGVGGWQLSVTGAECLSAQQNDSLDTYVLPHALKPNDTCCFSTLTCFSRSHGGWLVKSITLKVLNTCEKS